MPRHLDRELPDTDLVLRTRRGDAAAFDALVRRHYRTAYLVALGQTGNRADAEDACQDAFIRALERLDDCEPATFVGWLLRIVRNRASNVRDFQRLRSGSPLELVERGTPPEATGRLERQELAGRLESALAALTPMQREVVLLHDVEGLSHRQIAEQVGCSEVMSRQHLFVARRALRAELGAELLEEYTHDG